MNEGSKAGLAAQPKVKNGSLIALVLAVVGLIGYMLWPFAGAIISAIVLGVVFFPLHLWVGRKFTKRSRNFNAFLSSLAVLLFFVIPLGLLTWTIVSEAKKLGPIFKDSQEVIQGLRDGESMDSFPRMQGIRRWFSGELGVSRAQFESSFKQMANAGLSKVSRFGAHLAKRTLNFLLALLLSLLTLFFVFRDGPDFYEKSMGYLPLENDVKERLTNEMDGTINGVIRGWFLTALAQGAVATLGYLIAQAPSALLLGVLTAVTGLIPSIGTALVWLPVGLLLVTQGSPGMGVFLLIYGVAVISLVDNILRPVLVGRRADLPFLYLLFALLGGLEIWGLKGVIIGPLLVATAPTLLEAFRRGRLTAKEND